MQAFGYSTETLQFMLLPLINAKKDPINSMGDDASLACLSDKPRLLYDYFKQLFAQVTNPPIDSIREEVIMSLECYIGPEGNLLDTTESQCHRLRVPHPILTNEGLAGAQASRRLPRLEDEDDRHHVREARSARWQRARTMLLMADTRPHLCRSGKGDRDGYALMVLSDRATQ